MDVFVTAQTVTLSRQAGFTSCLALGAAAAGCSEQCTSSALGGCLLHGGQALGWVEFRVHHRSGSKIPIIYREVGAVVKLVDVKYGAVCW